MTYETQYVDRNVAPIEYKQFGNDLLLTSMFYTLQGEGPFAGVPSVFVRFAGCNLGAKNACPFCDTDFRFAEGKPLSVGQVYERAVAKIPDPYLPERMPVLVVTGGEPMLQAGITRLTDLVAGGLMFGVCQIESNGTLLRAIHDDAVLVVSPKVNTVLRGYAPLRPDVFERANHLKFVVSADPGSPYHVVPDWADDFAARTGKFAGDHPVYVSPIAPYKRAVRPGEVASMWYPTLIDHDQAQRNHHHAAKLCMARGYTLSLQQHLYVGVE